MSLRLDMLQAATKAPKMLGAAAGDVEQFITSQLCSDGGFRGRGDGSDLYFTAFGLNCLLAMGRRPPQGTADFLRSFGCGDSLDFVHLACLGRCWASLGHEPPEGAGEVILGRIERYRSADGGYSQSPSAATGSAYGCFLAMGAYQDLGGDLPRGDEVAQCLESLRVANGGYANFRRPAVAMTPATAAAITSLNELGYSIDEAAGQWLMAQCRPGDGFLAAAAAPVADLLSTATALHALATIGWDLTPIRRQCIDFVYSLADPTGAFHANRIDKQSDCEYTFYGLLALGHLSE